MIYAILNVKGKKVWILNVVNCGNIFSDVTFENQIRCLLNVYLCAVSEEKAQQYNYNKRTKKFRRQLVDREKDRALFVQRRSVHIIGSVYDIVAVVQLVQSRRYEW